MKLLAVAALLFALGAKDKKKAPEEPADPNAVVAKTHGGKVWVHAGENPSSEGDRLASWLGGRDPVGALGRTGDAPWAMSFVAVFKKPVAKGPVTVQFFEKGDSDIVDQASLDNDSATLVYQAKYELEPDKGFNKGRTYVVKVGQIIKNKFQSYASGELSLK
jgi:hypothetical protein